MKTTQKVLLDVLYERIATFSNTDQNIIAILKSYFKQSVHDAGEYVPLTEHKDKKIRLLRLALYIVYLELKE
jgi:hypothetical protein